MRLRVEQPAAGYLTPKELLRLVNGSYRHHGSMAKHAARSRFFGTLTDLAPIAGDIKALLPKNVGEITEVELPDAGYALFARRAPRPGMAVGGDPSYDSIASVSGAVFAVFGDYLYVRPAQGTWRVHHEQAIIGLTQGALAVSAVTTQIILPAADADGADDGTVLGQLRAAPYDDVYNGTWVEILSGAQAGKSAMIVDYTGATRIATLSSAIGATANGDQFAMVPRLPADHHDIIAVWAALMYRASRDDPAPGLREIYGGMLAEYMSAIDSRVQIPEEVLPVDCD